MTIEKLATLHDDNRRGLLVARDELAGWFGSFTKYKGKAGGTGRTETGSRCISGADAIVYDRKTGEKTQVFVPHAATSITGGIQPGRAQAASRLTTCSIRGWWARIIFALLAADTEDVERRGNLRRDQGSREAIPRALFELRTGNG